MPSTTFLNLPAEKKQRLIDAAWKEVARVSFDKVSINRMIRDAEISRGSFYQYFEDKQDMLCFLLRDMKQEFWNAALKANAVSGGDLFCRSIRGYDWVMERWRAEDLRLCQLARLAQLNPELNVDASADRVEYDKWHMDCGQNRFWEEDGIVWEDHIELLNTIWSEALLNSFRHPEKIEQIRERLEKHLKILRRGMLIDEKGER